MMLTSANASKGGVAPTGLAAAGGAMYFSGIYFTAPGASPWTL